MPHVVTQSCCSDASCVYACPVNCIHPTPDEPDFLTAEMVHIDPNSCVDCGACITACPVDAIKPHSRLGVDELTFIDINAGFFPPRDHPLPDVVGPNLAVLAKPVPPLRVRAGSPKLRVAVVGSGPAAMYAADEVLTVPGATVDVIDRLPVPYGLVRAGVAPDHQRTKRVTQLFDIIASQVGFTFYLGVDVGRDVTHEELAASHHAVIYAVGASSDNRLTVPGAELPGVTSATEFVAWYNGHPDFSERTFDLSHERVVIVGNGNVALDVARILTADPETLAPTDIAGHALAALRTSKVREVVIVARRGPAQSAFTVPEFVGLTTAPDVTITAPGLRDALDPESRAAYEAGTLDSDIAHKLDLLAGLDERDAAAGDRRIVFRYLASPTTVTGESAADGVELALAAWDGGAPMPTGVTEHLDAGLVLSSIGYRGVPVPGVPFDESTRTIPNIGGRVVDDSGHPFCYVTGWIKRGPSGFIGTNKSCAQETVQALVDDFNKGLLPQPTMSASRLDTLVRRRRPDVIDGAGWKAINAYEKRRGHQEHRIRVKVTSAAEAHRVARRA